MYIIVTDIPGTSLDMDGRVHMLMKGMIAELILKLEPRLYWKDGTNIIH